VSRRPWYRRVGPLIALVGSFLIWEGVVKIFHTKPFILPAPITVVTHTWDVRSELLQQSVPTLEEIWLGFAIAVAAGLLLAIPIAYSPLVEGSVLPILVAVQVTPIVAVAPLFLIWLGFGMTPKIAVAALVAFFPVVINTTRGLRAGEPEMVQWMRSLGARPWEIFFKLSIRWAMPYIMAALKVAITLAAVGALIGEFIGTDRGLGYMILRATTNLDTPVLYGVLLFVCFLGIVAYGVIAGLERVALSWQHAAEGAPQT
jgi:NitT/TauT family transport system permease protein